MSLLSLLWWSSLAFGAGALVWMFTLIAARLVRERVERARAADQDEVRSLFLEIMDGGADAPSRLQPYGHRARLIAEALMEVIGLIRGAERDRLIAGLVGLGADERLRRRLTHGGRAGRIAAAEALSAFPGPNSAAALRAALAASRDADFRVAALNALLDLGGAPALADMVRDMQRQGLQDSRLYEPVIRRAVAAAPLDALEVFVQVPSPPAVKAVLAEALGAMGDYRALQSLTRSAASLDQELRIASVRALGLLGHPAASDAVVRALADEAWEVRAAASEAVGRIGLASAIPDLGKALDDPAWWVRFRAGEALTMMGEPGLLHLQAAARSDQDLARRAASLALAERGLSAAAA